MQELQVLVQMYWVIDDLNRRVNEIVMQLSKGSSWKSPLAVLYLL